MYFLGYDLGSSAIKAALLDGDEGRVVARSAYPDEEMPIAAPRPGWAEQEPESWWLAVREATARLLAGREPGALELGGIGISYQMHGLVLLDERGASVRPAIIWCDSRAVETGEAAFRDLGRERCLARLLNSPGNFTAAKLAWVREHEPERFERARTFLLPGDYLAFRLTGVRTTTLSGLSEAVLWDFASGDLARFLLERFGIAETMVPERVPTFGEQGRLTAKAALELGLPEGVRVSYRAGDQPNNALSLAVLEPGEIAANAGTSGVVYGVTDVAQADPRSRVNSFAHVNHGSGRTRLGVLLCINGTGSAFRWLRQAHGSSRPTYEELDRRASLAPVGARGLLFHPFGNGAERMLDNRAPGARLSRLDFNLHADTHLARAVVEGIAFSFRYGVEILGEVGLRSRAMRAGLQNLFRSATFRETLASATGVGIELYDTDGAEGAARGAALGTHFYASPEEAFAGLARVDVVEPDSARRSEYEDAYALWESVLREELLR